MSETKNDFLKLNKLLKIFSASFIIRISYTLFGFINSVLLARYFGAEQYGVYVFTLSIVALLSIPTQLGMPLLVVREFAAFQAIKNWGLMKGLALRSHQFVFVVAAVFCSAAVLWLWNNPSNYSETKQQALLISLLLVPIISLGALRDAMLRGLRHVVLAQLPEGFIRPLLLMLCLLFFVFVTQKKASVAEMLFFYTLCSLTAFIVGWLFFKRYKPIELSSAIPKFDSKSWFTAALPIGLTGAMQVFNSELSVLYLGFLSLDVDIAFFRIAVLASGFIVIFMQITDSIVAPYLSQYYQEKKFTEIEQLIKKVCAITVILTLPVFIVFVVLGKWMIVTFYGESYQLAYYPLVILSVGQLFNAVVGPVALLLVMTGQQKLVTWGTLFSLVVNIILHFFLVPLYGMIGAAIATSICLILWNILLWIQIKKKLPIRYLL